MQIPIELRPIATPCQLSLNQQYIYLNKSNWCIKLVFSSETVYTYIYSNNLMIDKNYSSMTTQLHTHSCFFRFSVLTLFFIIFVSISFFCKYICYPFVCLCLITFACSFCFVLSSICLMLSFDLFSMLVCLFVLFCFDFHFVCLLLVYCLVFFYCLFGFLSVLFWFVFCLFVCLFCCCF